MKVKLKITIEQLGFLIDFVRGYLKTEQGKLGLSTLEGINLKSFIHFAMKKIIHASENSQLKSKPKTIAFDINVISAVEHSMWMNEENLTPYYLSLYIDMREQIRKQRMLANNLLPLH